MDLYKRQEFARKALHSTNMKSTGAAKIPGMNTAPIESLRLRRISNGAEKVLTGCCHELRNGEVFTGLGFNIGFPCNLHSSRTVAAKSNECCPACRLCNISS
jgi:hypothetical protein